MSFREKLIASDTPPAAVGGQAQPASDGYKALKGRTHLKLLEKFDLSALETLSPEVLRSEIASMVEHLLQEEQAPVNELERRWLIRDIQHEMLGFGPLELLMADPTVSDILVNSYNQIYVERKGKLELTNVTFTDEKHLLRIIDKIVSFVGRRIDESSPMVDARLPDGSRVNAVIPPVALDGPMMSIRRFAHIPLKMENLMSDKLRSITPEMAYLLEGLCKSKVNMIISGGTGAGKTTLLNILSGYIPPAERIVTIEDAAELQLQQPHVVRMETRPMNIEGKGEITQRALVRNALRMRPDRIIIGEVRGAEAVDMLQAMNTGHEGSLTTIHANNPRDALSRLENMIGMANLNLPHKASRQQIASAITVVIQGLRLIDGQRKITSIQEITGMEGEVITMQEIFAFKQTGLNSDGKVEGYFHATGVRPKFAERLRAFGFALPDAMFDPTNQYHYEYAMLQNMDGNFFLILSVLVFVAVMLMLEGLYMMWNSYKGPEAKKVARRLQALSASADESAQAKLLRQRMMSELPFMERFLYSLPRMHQLDRMLLQADLRWTVSRLLLTCAALGSMSFLLLYSYFVQPFGFSAIVSLVMTIAPLAYVRRRRAKRLAKMERQLPDALDLMTRALRAGHAFSSGLQMIGEEMQEPIASEFSAVADEVNFGVSLQQALINLTERVPITDLRYFVVSVLIQRDSGGNLTEVLTNLSRLIRERLKLMGRVRVLSSEGRLSAWVLGLMPFALGGIMTLGNREFMTPMWEDPIGISITRTMIVTMAIGILVLRKIARIRV